jgi:hypothetical protein
MQQHTSSLLTGRSRKQHSKPLRNFNAVPSVGDAELIPQIEFTCCEY